MVFNFRQIQANDFNPIDNIRRRYGTEMTAYSPQALYTWSNGMKLRVCIKDDSFFVSKVEYMYFYPVGDIDTKREFIEHIIQNKAASLVYMTESDAKELNDMFPDSFGITYSDSDAEYVYERKRLAEHTGGKYERLRRKLNRISADYNITSHPILESDFTVMRDITHAWSEEHGERQYGDTEAVLLSIDKFTDLNFHGLIIENDGRPAGFIFGYESLPDTFTMSGMKMLPEYHTNLSAVCIIHMARFLEGYEFVNLEEDCGFEGIRYMKKLMQPAYMLGSYSAAIKP